MKRIIVLALALLVVACRRETHDVELTVFAASSLRETFDDLARVYSASNPWVHVHTSFAGSQELRLQLEQGARADVFASADSNQMQTAVSEGLTLEPKVFARNEPCVAVSRASADRVRSFSDLPNAEHVVLGVHDVPIGAYAERVLERAARKFGPDFRARIESHVVSRELNTRQVLAKVALGEADAAIVYTSDVPAAHGAVTVVLIPDDLNVTAVYPIAVTHDAREPELARRWIQFVLSEAGQQILRKRGFRGGSP